MNIWANLKNFLYDKSYFIAYFNDNLYIYNFQNILLITPNKIILTINDIKTIIKGTNLNIKKSSATEIIITGELNGVFHE
ncbi:MAG: YabP/YqfC family sporulation protein [bacterium]|nr:YabP/YqfC family sporulation protein [bacterium]